MKMGLISLVFILSACGQAGSNRTNGGNNSKKDNIKEEILSLERKWLEAEFVLDTAYISTLIDSTFIGISANRVSNKHEELKGMYNNISAMHEDSVFLDSLKLED